jgi:F-type H+-transporting ATPase subunit b
MILRDSNFWFAISFVVFAIIVYRKAVPGLLASLDARGRRIADELEQAERLRDEAQALLAQFQRKQRDALQEAQEIIASAREEAERLRAQAAADLAVALKRHEQQALAKIAQAEAEAAHQVRDLAADLVIAAAERLLRTHVDESRDAILITNATSTIQEKLH